MEKSKNKISKNDQQLYWIFGVMVGIVVLVFLAVYFAGKLDRFTYQGLEFKKDHIGNIPLYTHTYYADQIIRTSGSLVRTNKAAPVSIFLRNDPRKIDVPIDGKITYLEREKYVYITISSEGTLCEYSPIAVASLGSFLNQNGFEVKAGVTDEEEAKRDNLQYITCENTPDRMVITLQQGEQSSINVNGNCYTINIADCDILPPVEKFIVQSIIDAKEDSA